jgi:hypothetical protein
MATEIKVWGIGTQRLWSFGTAVDIPADYEEIPPGAAGLTRKVKQRSGTVYLRMRKSRGGWNRVVGILAPCSVVEAVRAEQAATAEDRAKRRAASANARARREARLRQAAVADLLKIFPGMPGRHAEAIAARTFEVGSGRVGRTSAVDWTEKLRLGTVAWVRHRLTGYDELLADGRDREAARQQVGPEIARVLNEWKSGPQEPGDRRPDHQSRSQRMGGDGTDAADGPPSGRCSPG